MLRKLTLVGLVLLFGRGTTAQLVVGVIISSAFFAAHVATMPYKDHWDNCFKAASELHVFFAIIMAIALNSGSAAALEQEVLTPSFYEYFLMVTFFVLLPASFFATVAMKLRDVQQVLSTAEDEIDGSRAKLRRAYDLQRLGLATEDDRVLLERYINGWQVRGEFAAFLSHVRLVTRA